MYRSTMNTNVITALGMCKVCTEAIHSVARKRQDWTCESTCEHENAKTRKRENGRNQPVDAKTAKTAKTRKPRKRGKRENGENPKTRKRRKRRKPENGQKCSCFLVFNFSFSGFLGFLGFLVFSFSGFLVPLAAPFWPGRVFYVLSQDICLPKTKRMVNWKPCNVTDFMWHPSTGAGPRWNTGPISKATHGHLASSSHYPMRHQVSGVSIGKCENVDLCVTSWWLNFNPFEKYNIVKLCQSSPIFGVKIPKVLETTTQRIMCLRTL